MDEDLESQRDEDEALLAIYDGDPAFKRMSHTVFQYVCGENESPNSILLEFTWPPTYPTEKPIINLDTFYNQNLGSRAKEFFLEKINEKAEQYLGVAMTYTLIELVKDHLEDWFSEVSKLQPQVEIPKIESIQTEMTNIQISETLSKKEGKKELLTKAQKRRQWNRCDGHGEKARGWDWVDIVKHLSQTGVGHLECVTAN